jgi:site-specific recombinase XerD
MYNTAAKKGLIWPLIASLLGGGLYFGAMTISVPKTECSYQDHGLVFCRPDGKPIDPRSINLYFTRALKRAVLPAIRLHDARHTYATWLLEQGVSLKVVQTLLGHGSIAVTTDIYLHVSLELEKQAAAKLNIALTAGLL